MAENGYDILRRNLKENAIGNLYIFFGEESYLRDYYLGQMKKQLVEESFESFNYRVIDSPKPDIDELRSILDTLPMMAERSMTVVKDFDFFKAEESVRTKLLELLADLPDYCCLVFFYDTVPYKADGRMKKLSELIKNRACVAEFKPRGQSELLPWIRRRFKEQGRDIDKTQSEYLMFLCGSLMTNLESEIKKIAAYSKGPLIGKEDIDAVATPLMEAVVFELSNAVAEGDLTQALQILDKLLFMKEEPIMILSVLGGQMRSLHLANLAVKNHKNEKELADILGYRSSYPAGRLMKSARRLSARAWLNAARLCAEADKAMKQQGAEREEVLRALLVRIGGEVGA